MQGTSGSGIEDTRSHTSEYRFGGASGLKSPFKLTTLAPDRFSEDIAWWRLDGP